jgi:hypothetical protein
MNIYLDGTIQLATLAEQLLWRISAFTIDGPRGVKQIALGRIHCRRVC